MPTSPPTDRYRDAATAKFNGLLDKYRATTSGASFWKLGNTFDTMIDYLEVIDGSKADQVADLVLEQYPKSLNREPPDWPRGYDTAWFDDFGWWTIASRRASLSRVFNPAREKEFEHNIMWECWNRFRDTAPSVWERRKPDTYNSCEPAVAGGAWNEYWKGTDSKYLGPNDGDPTHEDGKTLRGIQNTVTNTLYLMAAQRLVDTDPKANAAAEREFTFLFTWFSKEPFPLFHQFPRKNPTAPIEALMCERVSHFHDGSKDSAFQDNWFWTGDVGLMLGALTDRISRAKEPPLLDHATSLLLGAKNQLTHNGLLQDWSDTGDVPEDDRGDYRTGAGVFWRNLLHAWNNDDTLRGVIGQPDYQTFVQTNAEAAKNSTLQTFDQLTQDVAALTVATAVLP
jgi:hypothetical protein